MIKEDFLKKRVLLYRAETEVFSKVFDFLDEKSKQAQDAEQFDKLLAYKEVEEQLCKRQDKMAAEVSKLMKQYEFQKSKGK